MPGLDSPHEIEYLTCGCRLLLKMFQVRRLYDMANDLTGQGLFIQHSDHLAPRPLVTSSAVPKTEDGGLTGDQPDQ